MMLEDAHGTFIAIPLDVIVSWQVRSLCSVAIEADFKRFLIALCKTIFVVFLASRKSRGESFPSRIARMHVVRKG